MSELTLVGLHEDGEHVVLEGLDGQQFRVLINEALRAAVRRDRPQMEQMRAEMTASMPPREIQARIRAGASAEEVAEQAGMPVELVRRYDGPVMAERSYVAEQARATRIGHESGSPVLGDLVTDRLATRDVRQSSITWDAFRNGPGPWTVEVQFEVAGTQRSARWTYDAGARRVRAIDDEARWLSETELANESAPRRHLAAVHEAVFDVEVANAARPRRSDSDHQVAPGAAAARREPPEPARATQVLLDDLAGRRGVRQEIDHDNDEDELFTGFGPQGTFEIDSGDTSPDFVPAAHPPASRPDEAIDAQVLRMPVTRPGKKSPDHPSQPDVVDATARKRAGADDTARPDDAPVRNETRAATKSRGRKGRASVPSWDEIVFGAKHE